MYLCLALRPFFNFKDKPKVGAFRLEAGDGGGLGRFDLWMGTSSSSEVVSIRFKGPSSSDDPVESPFPL